MLKTHLSNYQKVTLIFLVLSGCSTPAYMDESTLHRYIRDKSNGLSEVKEGKQISMTVSYRPDDFMIRQELVGETDSIKVKEVFDRYENYIYFVMQLGAGGRDALYGTSRNQEDFNEKLQTLSFRMNQYINLTTSNLDTIPVADFYYSRMFGLSKSADVLVVFNEEQVHEADWVSFNTKEFGFKTGFQSFRFDTRQLKQTPKLEELRPYYEMLEKN